MARAFLAYWKPSTVDTQVQTGGPQNHAASNQFGRVAKGDTVWLVTVRDGRLRLVTRIVVEHVTGQAGAALLLRCQPADLVWEAEYHIVAAEGTELEILDTDIQHLAPSLRFESVGGHDRLFRTNDGTVNAQQLQTMRVLSSASAELLAGVMPQSAEQGAAADDHREQFKLPEEVPSGSTYTEGSVQQILVNRYERDPEARKKCISHYGTRCSLCGFDFVAVYGEVMAGFIHVHHLNQLSNVGVNEVDPIEDLRPVCPNCHAVLHRREPPYSLDEVRHFLQARRGKGEQNAAADRPRK
jgi:hypothetical protein